MRYHEIISETPSVVSNPKFERWFAASKCVNPDGTPKRVYHGTTKDFDAFDLNKSREGLFFAEYPVRASNYADDEGGRVLPCYLRILNPADFKTYMRAFKEARGSWVKAVQILQSWSYDGIFTSGGEDNMATWIVFSGDQVKSAIGNNGNFDTQNPNIHEALTPVVKSTDMVTSLRSRPRYPK